MKSDSSQCFLFLPSFLPFFLPSSLPPFLRSFLPFFPLKSLFPSICIISGFFTSMSLIPFSIWSAVFPMVPSSFISVLLSSSSPIFFYFNLFGKVILLFVDVIPECIKLLISFFYVLLNFFSEQQS
ncbi:hypothetical protein HJG60_011480 [Phyllostomus discolor]|uniref:Uncharacterized protein n=1 Tax=Phyllostomus discolor TaxID=89673 RepID=A0A834E162_9CHIR|nr:hypothetical protein HJG60_011480 [Phyllostomus discolor]